MVQTGRGGRPRSQEARAAVLHAVDDLLLEVGYAAMTMKGIAERAGVSRQTVYRWWSTKAEVLAEASAADALDELALGSEVDDPEALLSGYLELLTRFLTRSPAGLAYRALLGEAQHDAEVAALVRSTDVLGGSARRVVERALPWLVGAPELESVVARLVGPTFYGVTTGGSVDHLVPRELARALVREAVEDDRARRGR
ncbi:TetR/AcrR family transcriptional regulator [Pseudonocardia alni]|uniref:TetR/AcrR family transcriptional regulator n=1 Tax=Pseudonocardia alni TaxID=33907 RepID=UPI00280BEBC3|nr:TetR/AcrR family transcriptional regulator [Pseudonocardia alni]